MLRWWCPIHCWHPIDRGNDENDDVNDRTVPRILVQQSRTEVTVALSNIVGNRSHLLYYIDSAKCFFVRSCGEVACLMTWLKWKLRLKPRRFSTDVASSCYIVSYSTIWVFACCRLVYEKHCSQLGVFLLTLLRYVQGLRMDVADHFTSSAQHRRGFVGLPVCIGSSCSVMIFRFFKLAGTSAAAASVRSGERR
jgi:hypothetical protein